MNILKIFLFIFTIHIYNTATAASSSILWSIENSDTTSVYSAGIKFGVKDNRLIFYEAGKIISFEHTIIAAVSNTDGRFIAIYSDSENNLSSLTSTNPRPGLREIIGQGAAVDIVDVVTARRYKTHGYIILDYASDPVNIWSEDGTHAFVLLSKFGELRIYSTEKISKNQQSLYISVHIDNSCTAAPVYERINWLNNTRLGFSTVYCGVETRYIYDLTKKELRKK